ncbi:MAG: hypothetical protein ABGZ49_00500 [Akkermansiaceae bacterium]
MTPISARNSASTSSQNLGLSDEEGLRDYASMCCLDGTNVHGIGPRVAPQGFESPDDARDKIRKLHLGLIADLAR